MRDYTIHGYPLVLSQDVVRGNETIKLELPASAIILSADVGGWHNDGDVSLWCMINTKTTDTKTVEIMVLGTDFGSVWQNIVTRLKFISTVVHNDNCEVYHVFQLKPTFNIPFLAQEQSA